MKVRGKTLKKTPYIDSYTRSRMEVSVEHVWVSFWTSKPLKRTPQDTHNFFVRNFLKCLSQAYY